MFYFWLDMNNKKSRSVNKILVPVDFSDQSLIALEQACDMAGDYQAEITLLYVNEESGMLSKVFSDSQKEALYAGIMENLEKLASETCNKSGLKIDILIRTGNVYERIVEEASQMKASFIIIGCNSGSEKKKFIGANSLRVIREANCPVITVKGRHKAEGQRNIILPLDLAKETQEKVRRAIELAKTGKESAIRVVSVLFSTDEFIVNRLIRHLAQVKSQIEKENIECTAEIVKGVKGEDTLAQNIIDYASHMEGDLIMIMTQQEVDSTDFFLGTAAQEIINTSEIPVLSIIPQMKRKSNYSLNPVNSDL
jgi:nucleotide-binding universal stress UspA family protein